MKRTTIRRPFAGQERDFCLRIQEQGALEKLCEAGIYQIVWRLNNHQACVADLRETIRLGLRGGGMSDAESTRLIMSEMDGHPLNEFFVLAVEIINATVNGLPPLEVGDASGKQMAEGMNSTASPPGI